jgi:hypothetical protein
LGRLFSFTLEAALGREPLLGTGAIVERMRRARGQARQAPLALGHRLRLDPVLAEGGEVDHQISCVEHVLAND